MANINDKNTGVHGAIVTERNPLFSGISPAEYEWISEAGQVKDFARGKILYTEGDSVRRVLLLTSGFAKTKLGQSGRGVILRLSATGDLLGATDLFATGRHGTTSQALRSCSAIVWDAPAFKALVERSPLLLQNMTRILGRHLQELDQRFREVSTERAGSRVARQLVRLVEQIGRPVDGEVEIGLSREELAQMTGTSVFTVSRLVSTWQTRGVVTRHREAVKVLNVQSLRAISEEIRPISRKRVSARSAAAIPAEPSPL